MTVILKNNAFGFLQSSISNSATSISLQSGYGANFPSLSSGEYFYATFADTAGAYEIVKCTARAGDVLTVTRAQEGTTAQSFAAGSRVELRVTAQSVIDAITDRAVTTAAAVTIADAGNYYTSGNVEGALQEAATFVQTGTSAVTRTRTTKLRETRFSVKDFGAVGDGAADDTNAIKACMAAAAALVFAGNSGIYGNGVYTGSMPIVYFPAGVYRITAALSPDTGQALNYVSFLGEKSILTIDPGVVCFGGVGFQANFEGLTFRSGAVAISLKTNNIDTTMINVVNCEFNNQTTASIRADSGSQSTHLNVRDCKYTNYLSTGYFLYLPTVDRVTMEDSWVFSVAGNQAVFYFGGNAVVMKNVTGVPSGALATTGRWIDFYGGSLTCYGCRFGGEDAGAPIVYNYANNLSDSTFPWIGSTIILKDCDLFAGGDGRADRGAVIAKAGLPARIHIEGCNGPVSAGRYIVDQMTSGTLLTWLDTLQAGGIYPPLSIWINNNRNASLSSSAGLTTRLLPYCVFEQAVYTATGGVVYLPNTEHKSIVSRESVQTPKLTGATYPETSTTTGVSIIDTGIFGNTAIMGHAGDSVYELFVAGDPNTGGSAAYRDQIIGYVFVNGVFSGGDIKYQIAFASVASATVTGVSELTVSAVFWDGSSESSAILIANANTNQIRIKVSGYDTGYEGAYQTVRLIKRYA